MRDKLVAAYIPGFKFSFKDLLEVMPDIPPCNSESQISCLNTWLTYSKDVSLETDTDASINYFHLNKWINVSGKKIVCINPIAWTDKNISVSKVDNQGSFLPMDNEKINHFEQFAGAQCRNGVLIAKVDNTKLDFLPFGEENYHMYDFNYYYVDIRNNAVNRTKKWYISRN